MIRFLCHDARDLRATPAPGTHAKMLGPALIGAHNPCNPTLATLPPPLHPSAMPAPSAPEPNHCTAVIPPLHRTGAPAKQRIGSASTPGTSPSTLPSTPTFVANLPRAPPSTRHRSSPPNSLHHRPARFRASVSTSRCPSSFCACCSGVYATLVAKTPPRRSAAATPLRPCALQHHTAPHGPRFHLSWSRAHALAHLRPDPNPVAA